MYNTNATSFRKNLFNLLEKTIKYNEVLNISTKEGNAVLLSEEEYNGLLATAEIMSNSSLYEKIQKGMEEDIEDCVAENGAQW
ncbi:MAG: hypothetical protein K5634_02065 [Sphaerochaetaceae bacterium]|nr:hypothetical protein [Sphaerochaetaceae bacterium]